MDQQILQQITDEIREIKSTMVTKEDAKISPGGLAHYEEGAY